MPTTPLPGVNDVIVGSAVALKAIKRKNANNVLQMAGKCLDIMFTFKELVKKIK